MKYFIKNNYLEHKETIHNFIWRSLQIFGKQGITFFIFIICAKLLTSNEFGVYNYILAAIFFLIIFGDFGISAATSKYVAEYSVTDKDKLRYILFNSLIIIVCLGFIITLVTVLFGSYFLKDKYIYAIYALPLIFLAPISSLYDGVFRGLKRFKELAIISLFVGLISIVFVYFLINSFGLVGALISQNLFYFLLVTVLFFTYGKLYFKLDKGLMKTIGKYSMVIGTSSVGFYLYTRFDILVLGYFGFIEQINSFELFAKINLLLGTLFMIMGQVIAPEITSLISKNEYKKVLKNFIKFVSFGLLLSVLLSIIIYCSLPSIVKIYFPNLFTDEFLQIFSVLIWVFPLNMISGLISQGFTISTGNAKLGLLTIPFGGLNIIMALIFISSFGFIGVAYSSVIVSFISKLVVWFLLYRELSRGENG